VRSASTPPADAPTTITLRRMASLISAQGFGTALGRPRF
jgi:hypothetical protein